MEDFFADMNVLRSLSDDAKAWLADGVHALIRVIDPSKEDAGLRFDQAVFGQDMLKAVGELNLIGLHAGGESRHDIFPFPHHIAAPATPTCIGRILENCTINSENRHTSLTGELPKVLGTRGK
jgi:hypothetical protein